MPLEPSLLRALVRRALREDVGPGDVTTESLVPPQAMGRAVMVVKAPGVIAGLEVAAATFRELDDRTVFTVRQGDGTEVAPGTRVAEVHGPVRALLTGERVALNFVQRLSGIATQTRAYVRAVAGTSARIVDTRKTTPGLRMLEKYAVRVGGGFNHRFGLYDAVLIKDNHLVAAGGITAAIQRARAAIPHTMKVEVEAETLEQVEEAVVAGADIILLDNMAPALLRQAVARIGGRALTEASGGITLENVAEIAATGVDLISVGALTHSVKALDVSLELEQC
jgi:nicotinate-nucleotide pyrophosphorylase (carboxylating)